MKTIQANIIYKRQADALAAVHLLWVLTGVIMVPLAAFYPQLRLFAGIFTVVTLISWAIWRGCPCRIWEKDLRRKYDPTNVYEGTFLGHYIHKFFKIRVSDMAIRTSVWVLLGALLLVSIY